tara:strand:+ start:386 stop:571 length:186 start_codon:yes stop_codon:yes gene_type:complete
MTAKAKAIDLVNKFQWKWDIARMSLVNSKQCALICVDEILEFHDRIDVKYWNEVKQEINKL